MTSPVAGTFADLAGWWMIHVRGGEAPGWLNDLLTADLADLEAGRSRRSLLLTPTGRVRADVSATRFEDGILLLQDPAQPSPIAALLAPYVLSSDVELVERTDLSLIAFPELAPEDAPAIEGTTAVTPSVLGPGVDLLGPLGIGSAVGPSWRPADAEALERWRIERGAARFPVDLGTDSLPHEAALGEAVAFEKGCYLGQEAVAKVRNLGHPPFVLLAVRAASAAGPGEDVLAGDRPVGTITSAAPAGDGGTAAIARVRWAARGSALSAAGAPLEVRGSATG